MARSRTIHPGLIGSQIADADDRPLVHGPTLVYRFYASDGALLYIGVTGRLDERITAHRRKAEWWPLVASLVTEWQPNMWTALDAERAAICAEAPAFNKRSVSAPTSLREPVRT